jgi:hypothetical protein
MGREKLHTQQDSSQHLHTLQSYFMPQMLGRVLLYLHAVAEIRVSSSVISRSV